MAGRVNADRDIEHDLRRRFCVDYKQSDALRRIDGRPNRRIFSFETARFKPGCRKFVTADLRDFYMYYRCCAFPRHFYEIITEGHPCRLYFDLEYYTAFNVTLDSLTTIDRFLDVCAEVIERTLALRVDRQRTFHVLDSSTAEKFSAHVIVHLPDGRLFPSNTAMKPLVHLICQHMLERNVGLVVGEKGADDVKFLCDLAVYTKNRNFRLFLSSKCGRESVLRLADYSTFYGDTTPSNAQIFLDSLIVPKDYKSFAVLTLPEIIICPKPSVVQALPRVENALKQTVSDGLAKDDVVVLRSGPVPSPFPELDDHMSAVFRRLKPDARIRIWRIIFVKSTRLRTMQYQLYNCRFCYNKGREHRSQNVYWSVNLDEFYYEQRCFDVVDCFRFSSEKFPLPDRMAKQLTLRIAKIYERLLHDLAFSESFYSSFYDHLFEELMKRTEGGTQSQPIELAESDEENAENARS